MAKKRPAYARKRFGPRFRRRAMGVVSAIITLSWLFGSGLSFRPPTTPARKAQGKGTSAASLQEHFDAQRHDVLVDVTAEVIRLLPDDERGSRHQRFLIQATPTLTVLIAHNIDLAPRLDALDEGDRVRIRGIYEHTDKGGVIHWTHHDPRGKHPGGFLEHEGRRYQ